MESQPEPLLKYAEELLQSFSRLIVYSGDILRSLPEPRQGLGVANIKPKKEESTAFLREWQHLESVFDEYLIRLNDIRKRAHEELEAARIRCLAGEDVDLTLPESVVKLGARLEKYKRQYDMLQRIISGTVDVEELEESAHALSPPRDSAMEVSLTPAPARDGAGADHTLHSQAPSSSLTVDNEESSADHGDSRIDVDTPAANSTSPTQQTATDAADMDDAVSMSTPMSVQSTPAPAGASVNAIDPMDISTPTVPDNDTIDVDATADLDEDINADNQAIELDSNSDVDVDDEDMEDIFQ
ncbi:hypothetical protein LPJ73_003932 [Coemansia sp. RSA 2703]|nr:hypothetical protein LPJ73_003932 [Coemansia sp. RSA 2703]KAJ2376771.1 hypothetical protein IW150_001775 [Coemansia sp. RSA 2607]KAJ2391151.1 hypothetical protein GGI05_003026 [Coemansia sp. RSA 2603]